MVISIWILTALAWALWSLGAWGLHLLLAQDASRLGELGPLIDTLPERVPYLSLIDNWLPGWREALKLIVDGLQLLFGWIGTAAPVVVWTLWTVGTVLLAGLAIIATYGVRSLTTGKPLTRGSATP